MSNKITGKVLAIQLGREETQLVLLSGANEILHGVSVPTPAYAVDDGMIRNPDAIRDMLKKALEDPAFKKVRKVLFTLCTSQVITETVTTPDLPEARLEKLLRANVDMYFPVDTQDYQLVWQVIGPKHAEDGLKELAVQLWAIPTAMVNHYYTVANACGLSVVAIDYCGHSMASAVGASFANPGKAGKERKKLDLNMEISFGGKKKEEPADEAPGAQSRQVPDTDLHLLLDKDLLGMTFVQNNQVVLQRIIRCGNNPEYQFGELAMMLEYFRSMEIGRGSTISGIISGHYAKDERIVAELEDILGLFLVPLDVSYDLRWSLCVGAARTDLEFGIPTLDVPVKARRRVQSQLWQYALVLAGALVLMAVILFTLSSRLSWNSAISSLENERQTLTIQAQKTAGFADNYYEYEAQYNAYSNDWDTIFGSLQTYNDNLVLVLEELETILPENSSVAGLQIAADGLNIQFACETKEEAAYLIMALRDMQYADLMVISNLQGGGVGPATSYGSDDAEEPPTEGSYDPSAPKTTVSDYVASELTQDEFVNLAVKLSGGQLELIEARYSVLPPVTYSNLDALKTAQAANAELPTLRAKAVRAMLKTNPFAMSGMVDLMIQDMDRGNDAILLFYVVDEVVALQKEGAFENQETMYANVDRLVDALVKDETTLTATEQLLCTDSMMERSYIHYLEAQLQLRYSGSMPYLSMAKIADDLMAGGFSTSDADANTQLSGLMSAEALQLLKKLGTETEVAALVALYNANETTENATVDALINNYLSEAKTTGDPELDAMVAKYIQIESGDDNTGDDNTGGGNTGGDNTGGDNTGDDNTGGGNTGGDNTGGDNTGGDNTGGDNTGGDNTGGGNTGGDNTGGGNTGGGNTGGDNTGGDNTGDDNTGGDNTGGGNAGDDMIANALNKYLTEGESGYGAQVDGWIKSYFTTGSANALVDPQINAYINSGKADALINAQLDKYVANGNQTDNEDIQALIQRYYANGSTTGNTHLDGLIAAKLGTGDMDDSGYTETQVIELINQFFADGKTSDSAADGWISSYLTTGTTASTKLDGILNNYVNKGYLRDEISQIAANYAASGSAKHAVFNKMIENYKNGTLNNTYLKQMLDEHKDQLQGSGSTGTGSGSAVGNLFTQEQVNTYVAMYELSGKTNIPQVDALLLKYKTTGTTGFTWLDPMVKKAYQQMFPGGTGNSGNTSGSGESANTDTRIFFTAVLGYNDELKYAELTRKGLSYSDKIEPLGEDE